MASARKVSIVAFHLLKVRAGASSVEETSKSVVASLRSSLLMRTA